MVPLNLQGIMQHTYKFVVCDYKGMLHWEKNDISYSITKKDMPWKYHILVQMSVCRIDRNIMKAVLYRIGQYFLYKNIDLSDYSPDHACVLP